MTTTTGDPNRALWEARARGEQTPAWETLATEPGGVEAEAVDAPAGLWLRPPDAPVGPVILAIHGGGFVGGSVVTHRPMFSHLARAAGVSKLAVEYGLVPEHMFPCQLDTVTAAYLFTREMVRGLATGYLPGADSHDPLAAPMHADLRGLPPTYLHVGAEEALLEDSRGLGRRMRAAGLEVRLDEFPHQVHTFQVAAGRTTVADEAVSEAGCWLQSTLVR